MPGSITAVGLGPGDPGWITRKAWEVLESSKEVYLRTEQHPVVSHLPRGPRYRNFDALYDEGDDFDGVYRAIVERVLGLALEGADVVYAVPGDPTVGEATITQIRNRAKSAGVSVSLIHGLSFVEPCLQALEADALDGLYIGDSLEIASGHHPPFSPDRPALLGQVYSRMVAADLKLVLMNQYPDDHPTSFVHAAGTGQVEVENLPLHEIDHSTKITALSALYVPPLPEESAFESFQETVAHLRAPDGCPWDREQTHQSLRPHLLEEAYEALTALDVGDLDALREELGDLLLQIVLHAQIATEEGTFKMTDVIAAIQEKIIRRHPHVFEAVEVEDVDEVLHNWEALKEAEREQVGSEGGLLEGVPKGLPALAQALEIQERVARVGFDWMDVEGVIAKVREESDEFFQAENDQERFDELGDLLFALVNFARWNKLDPESALREANRRFRERFHSVESRARNQGKRLGKMTLDEMDELWNQVKDGEGG